MMTAVVVVVVVVVVWWISETEAEHPARAAQDPASKAQCCHTHAKELTMCIINPFTADPVKALHFAILV